tara:strand:- start:1790 stop:1975 length:186 start_codon:yes stop_codon:yes gene_type:complete
MRQIWDREERAEYRKLYREYKREGFDEDEAKRLARQDSKEIMSSRIDFATNLYYNTLKDLD